MTKVSLGITGAIMLLSLAFALPASAVEDMDNVFITGLNVGYNGATGWIGENYDAGLGFSLFFGYGITEYFSMEIDFIPMMMTSPSGDDVKDGQDSAVWGGFSNGGFGGFGIMGRLYPRKAFREADLKTVQPWLGLGLTYINFIWEYDTPPAGTDYDYDGLTNLLLDFRFGIDFYITEWVSIGPSIGLHKPFLFGDSLQGESVGDFVYPDDLDADLQSDWEGSLMWDAALGVKFQW
jgi:hypothetical protein